MGKKGKDFEEQCGYWGEKVVLKATQLGLNTCWVALTFSKGKTVYQVEKGEKLCCVIALGYGETQGVPHKINQWKVYVKQIDRCQNGLKEEWKLHF